MLAVMELFGTQNLICLLMKSGIREKLYKQYR